MKHIFLFEQSIHIQKVVTSFFSKYPDISVKTFSSIADAEKAFALKSELDLVIVNVIFGGEDSLTWLEKIKPHCPETLLIWGNDDKIERFRAIGFKYEIKKPFHMRAFFDKVCEIIGPIHNESEPPAPAIQAAPVEISSAPVEIPSTPVEMPSAPIDPPNLLLEVSLPQTHPTLVSSEPAFSFDPTCEDEVEEEGKEEGDIPDITMSVERLANHYSRLIETRSTRSTPPQTKVAEKEIPQRNPELPPAFNPRQVMRSVEVHQMEASHSLELEDVVVHSKKTNSLQNPGSIPTDSQTSFTGSVPKEWKDELREELDEALMRSLERAVPAKIDEKINTVWPQFSKELQQKIAADLHSSLTLTLAPILAEDLRTAVGSEVEEFIRQTIQQSLDEAQKRNEANGLTENTIEKSLHNEIQKWLSDNALSITKETVRAEIQNLMAEL